MKENNFSPMILYPKKLSIKIDGSKILPQKTKTKSIYDHQATTTEDSTRNSAHRRQK
jgi:hypothetical protein